MLQQRLGDSFSQKERDSFLKRNLVPGAVCRIDVALDDAPTPKLAILAATEPEPIFLLINSNLCWLVENSPQRRQCQLPILRREYPFLKRDSWIDCSVTFRLRSEELWSRIVGDLGSFLGELNPSTCKSVLQKVGSSKMLSKRDKRAIESGLVGR